MLLFFWVLYNARWFWWDRVFPPPVNFLENEDISLSLYPEGYGSVSIFTNEGITAESEPEAISTLRGRLAHHAVLGTFFVVPFYREREKLSTDHRQMWELRRLQDHGFEIAQKGYTHYSPAGGEEMSDLSPEEESDRIRRGRQILTELGFEISGYRSPGGEGTGHTSAILDRQGYCYGSNFRFPPRTPRTLLLRGFRGNIFFPYHPRNLKLLEMVFHPDPLSHPEKARRKFAEVHQRGGVFIFRTDFEQLFQPGGLDRLSEFLKFLKRQDTWICTVRELCRWWRAREKISIVTRWDGDNLDIYFDNKTPMIMKNARIDFKVKQVSSQTYRILNFQKEVVAAGFIPVSKSLQVTFPPEQPE